ncbi:MAG: hypothetical protein E6J13_15925 [Chloroflexi bacterium]|nr:MAG: hypothetical protein E6J13_15925 [Chloroflexota bacterium]
MKARPEAPVEITQFRVRQVVVDQCGRVTLRYLSARRDIHVGRAHKGARIRLRVAGDQVRIIREDGVLLRELTLERDRLYFGKGQPVHNVVRQVSSMS